MDSGPFHAGERLLQERAGAAHVAHMAQIGARFIRDHMPEQHREFFAELPFVVVGSVDAQGQPWATLLAGPPGFAHSPDPRLLRIDAHALPHTPIAPAVGMPIAVLGIQPHTRRRNRVNGRVTQVDERGFVVGVGHSFGNCPKYIQPREARYSGLCESDAAAARWTGALDAQTLALIEHADTFFIATAHPQAMTSQNAAMGVDVSHRGGPPGFVNAEGARLSVPDYVGNSFFNTLGNIRLNSRCGLLFIDFDRGDLLHLAASAEVVEHESGLAGEGAQRVLRMQVHQALRVSRVLPLSWAEPQL